MFDRRQREFRETSRQAQKAQAELDSQFVRSSTQASFPSSPSPSLSAGRNSLFSSAADAPTAPPASDASTGVSAVSASVISGLKEKFSLGNADTSSSSHSVDSAEAAREQTLQAETSKRKGPLATLIYGTKEGQQLDQEIERSFSQVLARGKYVHSIVFHQVKPDKVDEYVELVGNWYPRVAGTEDFHVHLVGSWRTEVGDCDTFGGFYPPSL